MLHGIIDVAVATLCQRLPHITIGAEILLAVFCGCTNLIHEERQYAVLAYVLSNILLGVIGAHSRPVVDVLLKDISQYVRVDVFTRSGMKVIKMPVPLVEECE